MEEPKGTQNTRTQVESEFNVKQGKMYKLYQLMSLSMSCIIQEIDKLKKDEIYINYDLKWLSYWDENLERLTKYIQRAQEKEKPGLPIKLVPWTAGFINLTENGEQTLERVQLRLGTSVKRCHNRLKKERTNLEYLHDVQKQLLLMKSSGKQIHGTQELNHMKKSLVDRIHHGSNKLTDEHNIFHEIEKINETIEIYTAPTQPDVYDYYRHCKDWGGERRRSALKYNEQHALKLALDKVGKMEKEQKGHIAIVRGLEKDREQVRKSVRCMEIILEKIYTKRKNVYNFVHKHEQQDIQESNYNEYQLLMTNVKELARNGDVVGLKKFFNMQFK